MPFDPVTDPLGISLKERARQQRQLREGVGALQRGQRELQAPGMGLYGPLHSSLGTPLSGPIPDPQWEGFFQALNEADVDRLADESVGIKRGMFQAPLQGLQQTTHQGYDWPQRRAEEGRQHIAALTQPRRPGY